LFGDAGVGTWPVGCGHPCIGCTEQGVGFEKPIHSLAKLLTVSPPTQFARPGEPQGQGATAGAVLAVAAVTGVAVGVGIKTASNLGKHEDAPPPPHSSTK
jgi:hydrogenase small subunit